MSAPTKAAKESGRNVGKIKVRAWISNDMSFWALLEQIRSLKGFKNVHEATYFCVYEMGKELGLETG
jgi:hypothetical protein